MKVINFIVYGLVSIIATLLWIAFNFFIYDFIVSEEMFILSILVTWILINQGMELNKVTK